MSNKRTTEQHYLTPLKTTKSLNTKTENVVLLPEIFEVNETMTVSDAAVKAVVCYETDLNVNWLSPLAYQLHCTSQKLPSDRIKDTVIYQSL